MSNRTRPFSVLAAALLSAAAPAVAPAADPPSDVRDVRSDSWVATDGLGRSLSATNRPPRAGRYVGVFYFMVHGTWADHDTAVGPYDRASTILDNSEILARLNGQLGPSNPLYTQAYRQGGVYWWGEPAVGYFLSDDEWVHRKNLLMLADAGVDVIFLDATNAVLYDAAETALFKAAADLRRAGNVVPKIGYVLHSHMAETAQRVYDRFYADGRYRDLWFDWLGKPLIMADADAVTVKGKRPIAGAVRDFFTWRESWAWTPRKARPYAKWFADGRDKWPWLDDYPQGFGWHDRPDAPEEVAVAMAGHPTDDLGRSFRGAFQDGGGEPPLDGRRLAAGTAAGGYFAQQWHRALEVDPQMVFVTGWNEWYATRFPQKPPYRFGNAGDHLPYFFVDEYNQEFSRDAMPMRGGHQDNYYMQLVEGVRAFKGARRPAVAPAWRSIDAAGGFRQWDGVVPAYPNRLGDGGRRDWPGWGKARYQVPAKRNEIGLTKVAADPSAIAFYLRCAAPISAPDGRAWMQLLVNADQDPATGWHGYDYLLNRRQPGARTASVERWTGKGWAQVGTADLRVDGVELMMRVPRQAIGLPAGRPTAFDFHWADDVDLTTTDPSDFWYRGAHAPDGRFDLRYRNTADGRVPAPTSRPTPLSVVP